MNTFNMMEIAVEVAHQLPDTGHDDVPRAEYRWEVTQIALDIVNAGIIDNDSEDIDEIISNYLEERGLT
jgi:hypothetical protein